MKFNTPYLYFCISAIVIFIAGSFTFSDKNALIDINIHDTYFIIHLFHLISLISLIYFIIGFIYWGFKKLKIILFNKLTTMHLFCSVGGLFLYFILMPIFEDNTEIEPGIFNESSILGYCIIGLFFIVIFSQIIFILNLIISLIKKLNFSFSN